MTELVIFALLFVAIAIGWFLGRRSVSTVSQAPDTSPRLHQGFNDVLNGRPDSAIDAFINSLEVNSETMETHFALGNQLRQKGEVERAVRVHQNLIAGTSLPPLQLHQAQLELARDYISAGLLDRAEELLLALVEESPELRTASRRHLLELYEIEHDWERAVAVATELLPARSLFAREGREPRGVPGQSVRAALAHYYCELAGRAREAGHLAEARDLLGRALQRDAGCTRAAIMLGEVEYADGNYRAAVQALRRVREQDPELIPETIATLRLCSAELGDAAALRAYLLECLASRPTAALVVAVADDILAAEGSTAAVEFLAGQLAAHPSLAGLAQLIDLQAGASQGKARANLEVLRGLVAHLGELRPAYRCGHCGFSGRHLHWHCPGCKHWGSIRALASAG